MILSQTESQYVTDLLQLEKARGDELKEDFGVELYDELEGDEISDLARLLL